MEASKLREQSESELKDELLKLRREAFNLRMQKATGELARTDQFRKIRRNIARVKTVLTEKKAGSSS
ncbi:MAG: 50S ribosomal protein L29 [Gammaproteobacteria bacterium]|nr:50S ribosomal protein L29 [Gammaproteobacteria bacterium]NND60034.1 50S ribosomal protein L29 [Gammaproteobacteria bacterium]